MRTSSNSTSYSSPPSVQGIRSSSVAQVRPPNGVLGPTLGWLTIYVRAEKFDVLHIGDRQFGTSTVVTTTTCSLFIDTTNVTCLPAALVAYSKKVEATRHVVVKVQRQEAVVGHGGVPYFSARVILQRRKYYALTGSSFSTKDVQKGQIPGMGRKRHPDSFRGRHSNQNRGLPILLIFSVSFTRTIATDTNFPRDRNVMYCGRQIGANSRFLGGWLWPALLADTRRLPKCRPTSAFQKPEPTQSTQNGRTVRTSPAAGSRPNRALAIYPRVNLCSRR